MALSLTVRGDGKIIVEIANNEFRINQNNFYRRERPNEHELALFDQYGAKVLDINYLNKRTLKVKTDLHLKGHHLEITGDTIKVYARELKAPGGQTHFCAIVMGV